MGGNVKEECRHFMANNGLPLEGPLITDGLIHRYSTEPRRGKRDEYYIAFEGTTSYGNPFLVCIFGSWRLGTKYEYKSYAQDTVYSDREVKDFACVLKKQRDKIEQETKRLYDMAACTAYQLWKYVFLEKPPTDEYTRYARLKGLDLQTFNVKYGKCPRGFPAMIVPVQNTKYELRTFQYISCDKNGTSFKKFHLGAEKRGNFHPIHRLTLHDELIFVTEGYATGVSVYEGSGITTIVAFDAGNIGPVIENITMAYPRIKIIIAGDNDEVGRRKAHEAAEKYGCGVIFPSFDMLEGEKHDATDFNDLYQLFGPDAVGHQLRNYLLSLQPTTPF